MPTTGPNYCQNRSLVFIYLGIPRAAYFGFVVLSFVLAAGCQERDVTDPSVRLEQLFQDPFAIELADAARQGKTHTIEKLIAEGADPNVRGYANVTPLFLTLECENKRGFLALLRHGADPNVHTQHGMCVVNRAAETDDPFFLREALLHGGDPNILNTGTIYQPIAPPFWYAIMGSGKHSIRRIVRNEHVRLLIAAGADVNGKVTSRQSGRYGFLLEDAAYNQSYSVMIQLLYEGGKFTDEGLIDNFLRRHLEKSEDIIRELETHQSQGPWYLKVIDFLNEQGAEIAPNPEGMKTLRDRVDPFELADLEYPREIEFAGETFEFDRAETSFLDAITLFYRPKATPAGGVTATIEITVAPGDISAATEAAAKTLEFRVAHKPDEPNALCELEIDLDENGFVVHHALEDGVFEMAYQRFTMLGETKGYMRYALIYRLPVDHANLQAEIQKLKDAQEAHTEQWRKFSPQITIRQSETANK